MQKMLGIRTYPIDDIISKSIEKNRNSAMIADKPLETYVNL